MIPHVTAPTFRPPTYETNHARPLIAFDAPCPACSQTCPWTASASGEVPHCPCDTTGEAA